MYCSNIVYYTTIVVLYIYCYTITNCILYIIAYKFQIFIKRTKNFNHFVDTNLFIKIKITNSKEPSRLKWKIQDRCFNFYTCT